MHITLNSREITSSYTPKETMTNNISDNPIKNIHIYVIFTSTEDFITTLPVLCEVVLTIVHALVRAFFKRKKETKDAMEQTYSIKCTSGTNNLTMKTT